MSQFVGRVCGIRAITWSESWLKGWRDFGEPVSFAIAQGTSVHKALNDARAAEIKFVPQSTLPPGEAYERHIFSSGQCPTRDNLHDFFNGLCWMRFPHIKRKLNCLQTEQIALAGVQTVRGPVRDALTLFDENAAFFLAPQPLWNALLERDWQRLFVELRPLWRDAQLTLFGHALLEKLICPRKSITAHVYRAHAAIYSIAELDAWIANDLSAEKLAGKPFTPLPVLGVPGWWAENENFSFYDDTQVFRPRR